MTAGIEIEVAYAEPGRSICKIFWLAPPVTLQQVRCLAAADPDFGHIDLARAALGVFGTVAAPDQQLQPGDRVEIYRPLAVDPKSARRARVREARHKAQ